MSTKDDYKNVHRVRVRRGGRELIYHYHRPTKTRLYSPPGSLAYEAELRRAALGSAPAPKPKTKRCFVYFVRAELTGLIKIGKAGSPGHRLRELQIGSAENLSLIGIIPDPSGGALEADIHATFARDRVRGEWFKPSPELDAFVKEQSHLPGQTKGATSVYLDKRP